MRQQVSHQPCQRKDGDTDTQQYGEEETAVDVAPEFPEFEPAEQFQRSRIKTFDRLDQFAVNSRNKGDRPARYSRDNIPIAQPFSANSTYLNIIRSNKKLGNSSFNVPFDNSERCLFAVPGCIGNAPAHRSLPGKDLRRFTPKEVH